MDASRCVCYLIFAYALLKDSAGQETINIKPYPTATVTEGGSITFTCTYGNNNGVCPSQMLFEWYLNGNQALLLVWTNNVCIFGDGDATLNYTCGTAQIVCAFTLTLPQVHRSQHGDIWQCTTGGIGIESRMYVNVPVTDVQLTPHVTSDVSLVENAPYTFMCETSAGRPQATVQWYKRSVSGGEVIIPGGSTSTEPNGTLVITKSTLGYTASRADEGYEIYCKANNGAPLEVTSARKPVMHVLCYCLYQAVVGLVLVVDVMTGTIDPLYAENLYQ